MQGANWLDYGVKKKNGSRKGSTYSPKIPVSTLDHERQIKLSPTSASRLIGPDCAYHLYSQYNPDLEEQAEETSPDSSEPPQ